MVKINLLPVRATAKKEILMVQLTIAALMLLVTLAVLGFLHFSLSGKINAANLSITKAQQELTRLNKVKAKVDEFKKNSKALEKKLDVIKVLSLERTGAVYLMEALVDATPENLWIENLKEVKSIYTMTGISLDYDTIARFMINMELSPFFDQVKIKSSTQKKIGSQNVHSFTVQAVFKIPVAEGR
ncbi:MAG: PilN domain-containing protein [bacterium]|nr:PilN domain-containing protein [bacterium]